MESFSCLQPRNTSSEAFSTQFNEPYLGLLDRNQPVTTTLDSVNSLFCLTLYNEAADDVFATLDTIAKAIRDAKLHGLLAGRARVCIIADGVSKLHSSTATQFTELGWLSNNIINHGGEDNLHLMEGRYQPIQCASNALMQGLELDITVGIKPCNLGKLDTHWWFFKKICHLYQPEYCFQVDAGTRLTQSTLTEMLGTFAQNPNIATVSSQILIDAEQPSNILQNFQCADFVIQRTILWMAENMSGYMSVVPGQLCGVRWSALTTSGATGKSPLDYYLAGLNCSSAQEKIMFLAEDRVMGFEILASKGEDHQLAYAGEAECYTDSCKTVNELLKQRRRWVNSAFTCRSWALVNFPRYLRDSGSPVSRKLRVSTAVLSILWSHTLDYFQPLLTILLLYTTYLSSQILVDRGTLSGTQSALAFAAIVISWLTPTAIALFNGFKNINPSTSNKLFLAVGVAAVAAITINAAAAQTSFSTLCFWVLILPALTLASAAVLGKSIFILGLRSLLQYFLLASPLNLMINSYAFCNMHDDSWGTKGLNKAHGKQTNLAQALRRFSRRFIALWLSINAAVITAILVFDAMYLALTVLTIFLVSFFMWGLTGCLFLKAKVRLQTAKGPPTGAKLALKHTLRP